LIDFLNPLIRGWCNYHNHVVSNEIFKNLDAYSDSSCHPFRFYLYHSISVNIH
ncbi:MAG: hypothetical protein JXB88_04925, partial [Spirochaetales bacterium]|nr:hypothetical protein [Spirochaetales bacterium]